MTTKELFLKEFSIVLTEKEAQQFASYQLHIVRAAMASTNRWLIRKAAMVPPIVVGRNGIVRSVLNTLQFRNGTAKPKPKFKPLSERAQELRELFQESCTSDNAWTLTQAEAEEVVKRYGMEKAKKVFTEIGRYDEQHQAEALDHLDWLLAQDNDFCVPMVTR